MRKLFTVLCVFSVTVLFGQIPVDTSYTPASAYKKDVKKYPFIKIAHSTVSNKLNQEKDIVYKTIEGRALHFDAFFNKESKKNPAVILIHGGGWKSGNKQHMHQMAQQIAQAGYSCFCIEYRLSLEAKYPTAVFDVKDAIKYIKKHATEFNANPKKVAVLGCSSGGQMAALIGTTNGNKKFEEKSPLNTSADVQAIIDMDGVLAFHHPQSQESEVAAFWLGGNYKEQPQVWEEASALNHTNKNTPPVLFINSEHIRFHAGGDEMIEILNRNGTYNETKTLDGSPHSFWFYEPWFDEITQYSVQFLDKIFK